jgi:hypothetical protein
MNVLYRNCLADLIRDPHVPTALPIPTSRKYCNLLGLSLLLLVTISELASFFLLHANSDNSSGLLDLLEFKGS